MKHVFMIKIQPKEFANALIMTFAKKPTANDVKNEIERIKNVTKSDQLKSLCSRCLTGISCYGVPSIHENNEGVVSWRIGGESEWSTKGYTAIKVMNVVEN